MIFYTALFIACVIAAIICLYLYHWLADLNRTIYRDILPNSKTRTTRIQKARGVGPAVNRTLTPWGWNKSTAADRARRTPAASSARRTPWGWPDNAHEERERGGKK